MFKTSSMWINALLDKSDHGLSHTLKGPGADVNGLTGIKKRWSDVSPYSIVAKCSKGFPNVATHKITKD
jgi:hypothetical protein